MGSEGKRLRSKYTCINRNIDRLTYTLKVCVQQDSLGGMVISLVFRMGNSLSRYLSLYSFLILRYFVTSCDSF